MAVVKGVCDKCYHREKCHRPCWFIESLLADVTDGSLERQTGPNEITHYGRYWEKRFSDFNVATLKKAVYEVVDENQEEPFPDDRRVEDVEFTPEQKTADIFYMRFFLGKSYKEIGEKHGMDHRKAAGYYSQGRNRVLEILKVLDGRDKALKFCKSNTGNSLTKHQKAFILNKVFGFAFKEIADLLGYAGPDAIQHKVNEMYHDYKKNYLEVVAAR